jgi:hypothetical protein
MSSTKCQSWLSATNSSASCAERPKWTYVAGGGDNYALVPRRVVISITVLLSPRRTYLLEDGTAVTTTALHPPYILNHLPAKHESRSIYLTTPGATRT